MVSRSISAALGRFLGTQRVAVAASLDRAGRPWASLLTGPAGFIAARDDRLVRLAVQPSEADPLASNLRTRPELGLVVLDPRTRQRVRLNGRGRLAPEGVLLTADEVFGNCPQYIQKRLLADEVEPRGSSAARSAALDDRQQRWIAGADTFFIASFDPDGGADASHRGGRPGFVRVLDSRRLTFPDYPGNNMFATFGNLAAYPRAGLLFVDFTSGDLLQLTGRTELQGDDDARAVVFDVDEVVDRPGASALRWELLEYSPANP